MCLGKGMIVLRQQCPAPLLPVVILEFAEMQGKLTEPNARLPKYDIHFNAMSQSPAAAVCFHLLQSSVPYWHADTQPPVPLLWPASPQ